LEHDTLGGSGTRGYGWVKVIDLKVGIPVIVGHPNPVEDEDEDDADDSEEEMGSKDESGSEDIAKLEETTGE
jgi:CRISPR/Cas system CSM-associated protein Csm3 (group 7 of RAMP superfamily)